MRGVKFAGLLGITTFVALLTGCVDDKIVYRDKPLFETPPQAAVGFLGYSNQDTKQTTCGNCHNTQQVVWKETKHANAWSDLQASGHATSACNDCHTVSALGNSTAAGTKVAYTATGDERYWDVQCESCHGAGLDHVQDPSSLTKKPMASFVADTADTGGCGGCHTGTHNPFVEEWKSSGHGVVEPHVADRDAASYPSCANCHDGNYAMKNIFNVTDNYVEKNLTDKHGITCVVCHDPHGNKNTAQLRMEASSHTGTTNLCYQCHQRNATPSGGTSRNAAHSPQGPMVLGDVVGWQPPGFSTTKIIGTHGSTANAGLCTTCHMASYALNSSNNNVGHTFQAIPCMANGLIAADQGCGDDTRTFKSCLGSGCHGTETAAKSALNGAESRLTYLSTELKRLVALAKVTTKGKAEWVNDTVVSPLEGVDFNSTIMEHDLSRGAHNPFYMDALLTASINYTKTTYGVQ